MQIGDLLNRRYTPTAHLGSGAMADVYQATDVTTGQPVAIKVLDRKLTLDPEMVERFKREGEALRQLRHRHIVSFVDTFQHEHQQVIVMEYVGGGSLYQIIKRGPLPVEQAGQIVIDLCDALTSIHRLNIIHRDIKPENILLAQDGTPRLTDLGVARLLSEGTRLTGTGTQIGTPYYMSPEAWQGQHLDAQTDIWSLGVVFYEMLTGQVPFGGETMATVMNKILTAPLPDIKTLRPDIPNDFAKVIRKMLTRDKARRYSTMREVAVDLERIANAPTNKPPATIPAWGWLAGGGVSVLIGGAIVGAMSIGLYMVFNSKKAAPLSTSMPPAVNILSTQTVVVTEVVPTQTPRPSNTPQVAKPTDTPLPPVSTPTVTSTSAPTFTPTRTLTPKPKPPIIVTCSIEAIFGEDTNKDQPGYQFSSKPDQGAWGDSKVTCGNKVYTTSRPALPPLLLPTGCSLFGEKIGVNPSSGDWWAEINYSGPASLGVKCSGTIAKSTFAIEIVASGGGSTKPACGYPPCP